MKALLRLSAVIVLLAVLGFCIFGFAATFEPMTSTNRMIWRTVYGMVGVACTCGLVRPLRRQWHLWKRRHERL